MKILLVVPLAIGLLVVLPLAQYRFVQRPARRAKVIASMLSSARMPKDDEVVTELERYVERRVRGSAIGEEIGCLLSLPVTFLLLWAAVGMPAFVVVFMLAGVGRAAGGAVSDMTAKTLSSHGPRLAGLARREPSLYLPRGQIITEIVCALLGVLTIVASALALLVDAPHQRAALAGLLIGLLSTTVILAAGDLQRRLLNAPLRAVTDSHLIAKELVLASALRDLFLTILATTAVCGYGVVIWTTGTEFWPIVFAASYFVLARLIFDEYLQTLRVPVALQVTSVTAA